MMQFERRLMHRVSFVNDDDVLASSHSDYFRRSHIRQQAPRADPAGADVLSDDPGSGTRIGRLTLHYKINPLREYDAVLIYFTR